MSDTKEETTKATPESLELPKDGKLTDLLVARKLVQLSQSAASRGIEFGLDFKTVKRLLQQKKCFYTGQEFQPSGKFARSIDRIDANEGYFPTNVVACTIDINSKKTNLSVKEITQIFQSIQRRAKKK